MRIRTQLIIVALVALGWGLSQMSDVRPVLAQRGPSERRNMAALESAVARNPDDVIAARELSSMYLERGMLRLVISTVERMSREVQRDARVELHVARALERLGDVQAASARVNGALNRCSSLPAELAPGAGCDVRTQTELTVEAAALDRMIAWNVTPVSDPSRAAIAHEIAVRPMTMSRGTF